MPVFPRGNHCTLGDQFKPIVEGKLVVMARPIGMFINSNIVISVVPGNSIPGNRARAVGIGEQLTPQS